MLDVHATKPGQSYENLPETFTIFITEHDVLKKHRSIVHIERGILETGESFNDEQHIIYVNAAVDDHTRISQLMHDFLATDYRSMSNTKLAELVKFYKNTKEEELCVKQKSDSDSLKDKLEEKKANLKAELMPKNSSFVKWRKKD